MVPWSGPIPAGAMGCGIGTAKMETLDVFKDLRGIDRRPLRELIYQALKRAIIRGEMTSGQRLVEERLARQMGASRTPVREALQRLVQEDLIERLPTKGYAVSRVTMEDIGEIFGIRSVLESYAAYLATERITEDVLEGLEKLISNSKKCLGEGDIEGFIELNTHFHDLLYSASRSQRLYRMIHDLRDYFYRYRRVILRVEGMPQISLNDHIRMLECMRGGDPEAVEAVVRAHILRGRDVLLREIELGRLEL